MNHRKPTPLKVIINKQLRRKTQDGCFLVQNLLEYSQAISYSVKVMMRNEINVLVSQSKWAWPKAIKSVFEPCGVNSLLAENTNDALNIIERRRIHMAILDMDSEKLDGLSTIRLLRRHYPLLPCILVSSRVEKTILSKALRLDVFSVISKPVEINLFQEQLNRLFLKKYNTKIL